MKKLPSATAFTLASILYSASSYAVTVTYTDQAAFLAALPGPASTLDFDSLPAGTTIADSSNVDGITFSYN